jgi:hypothetical protein
MRVRAFLKKRRQLKARRRHEREKELRERQRTGGGPEDVPEKVKGGAAGSGFPTGGG